ncbi:MAG: hypothetical protein FGF51_08505 [Candidatus Brockarchaeota archaeon]|nr:hypothetical protein [Candidatus Brockarchaeota archaeon]
MRKPYISLRNMVPDLNAQGEEPEYGVRVKRRDVEVEVWGSREFVETTFERLRSEFLQERVEAARTIEPEPLPQGITFTEFLAEEAKRIGREPDMLKGYEKILLIGYYLYMVEKRDFTYEDIEKLKEEARLSGLENPRQYMSILIKRGLVSETGVEAGKKVFKMLRRGLQYVENGFREAEAQT